MLTTDSGPMSSTGITRNSNGRGRSSRTARGTKSEARLRTGARRYHGSLRDMAGGPGPGRTFPPGVRCATRQRRCSVRRAQAEHDMSASTVPYPFDTAHQVGAEDGYEYPG